jgi:hypothetical protein
MSMVKLSPAASHAGHSPRSWSTRWRHHWAGDMTRPSREGEPPPGSSFNRGSDDSGATVNETARSAFPLPPSGSAVPAPGTYPDALSELRGTVVVPLDRVTQDVAAAHHTACMAWLIDGPRMRQSAVCRDTHSGRHRDAVVSPSAAAQRAERRNARRAKKAKASLPSYSRPAGCRGPLALLAALTQSQPKVA